MISAADGQVRGGGWRFVVAVVIVGAVLYFFFLREKEVVEWAPVEDTGWPSKTEAVTEMRLNLSAVVNAEKNYHQLNGIYIPCGPNPAEMPTERVPWNPSAAAGWDDLMVSLPGNTWFQYEVVVTGDHFEAFARTRVGGEELVYSMDKNGTLNSR
ncbi:MAG: hypothetical protein JW885_11435 [Deltaproteobacteria bacterium]|nr:hypothetical protein [Candidatus Zymogenaceae bacterium]